MSNENTSSNYGFLTQVQTLGGGGSSGERARLKSEKKSGRKADIVLKKTKNKPTVT